MGAENSAAIDVDLKAFLGYDDMAPASTQGPAGIGNDGGAVMPCPSLLRNERTCFYASFRGYTPQSATSSSLKVM